jgi:hypothetical protein
MSMEVVCELNNQMSDVLMPRKSLSYKDRLSTNQRHPMPDWPIAPAPAHGR